MALSEGGLIVDGFIGRAQELAVVAASAEAAAARRPSVVWVEGEAGSGKTALARQAVKALPAGFSVVRAQADELAADIAYELATQLGAVDADGPFVAGMSLLRAWSTAQDSGPVAVVVEDLHWADLSSSQALLSAVKRLDRDRVLVLITSRSGASVGMGPLRRGLGALPPARPGRLHRRRSGRLGGGQRGRADPSSGGPAACPHPGPPLVRADLAERAERRPVASRGG